MHYSAYKPENFGTKFQLIADVKSKFLCNGFPYLGRDESRSAAQSLSENVVLRLVEPFTCNGWNITTCSFFTTVGLAEKLKTDNHWSRKYNESCAERSSDICEKIQNFAILYDFNETH